MCRSAGLSSQEFLRCQGELDSFFTHTSFDLFCSVAFGNQMRTTSEHATPESRAYC